jgi:hypothetical protein
MLFHDLLKNLRESPEANPGVQGVSIGQKEGVYLELKLTQSFRVLFEFFLWRKILIKNNFFGRALFSGKVNGFF